MFECGEKSAPAPATCTVHFRFARQTLSAWPLPNAYGYNRMAEDEKPKFMRFYEIEMAEYGPEFDVDERLADYCLIDCRSLLQACEKFDSLLAGETGLHPFSSSITISSYVAKVWRFKYYKPEDTGIMTAPNER